ncbi:MAG: concanavalin A-like lectin/glucanase domain-containing protein [Benjaminiella poitrasii]|nr:MAG: concanavalin A-like lectin/glucanase domain-containing protein [Benjaminiella poitrasii]
MKFKLIFSTLVESESEKGTCLVSFFFSYSTSLKKLLFVYLLFMLILLLIVFYGCLTLIFALEEDRTSAQEIVQLNDTVICDCGFEDENHRFWTHGWISDYGAYKTNLEQDPQYLVMDHTMNPKQNGSLQRVFSRKNVIIDNQGDMTLTVNQISKGNYTSAAIGTKRNDFLYGTYRARMKTANVNGTISAFFFYHNDTSEIDIESLSRFSHPYMIFLSIQPHVYVKGIASSLTSERHTLGFDSTKDYHEYRFDWLPGSVKFYIDNVFIREMTTNVPNASGRIILNHWTDGNVSHSGGPLMGKAELKVSHLNLFFNSSKTKEPLSLPCQRSKLPCLVADIMSGRVIHNRTATASSGAPSSFASPSKQKLTIICLLILLFLYYGFF